MVGDPWLVLFPPAGISWACRGPSQGSVSHLLRWRRCRGAPRIFLHGLVPVACERVPPTVWRSRYPGRAPFWTFQKLLAQSWRFSCPHGPRVGVWAEPALKPSRRWCMAFCLRKVVSLTLLTAVTSSRVTRCATAPSFQPQQLMLYLGCVFVQQRGQGPCSRPGPLGAALMPVSARWVLVRFANTGRGAGRWPCWLVNSCLSAAT